MRGAAPLAQFGLGAADVGRIARERHREVIHAHLGRELDVFEILVGEGRRGQAAALLVEALAVGELTARARHALDARADDAQITSSTM